MMNIEQLALQGKRRLTYSSSSKGWLSSNCLERNYTSLIWVFIHVQSYFIYLTSGRGKRPFQKPLGRQNFIDDFSTGFSLITREQSMLKTCKLAQKILNSILRRMVYNLCGNKQYLKSQFGENGRFSCILGFFPIFMILSRQNEGRGMKSFIVPTPEGAFQFSSLFKSIQLILFKLINYSIYLNICTIYFF